MACLVKFGFGGVQDFISQARMTRDLAAGSRLIQTLAIEAAQEASNRMGAQVLLPPLPSSGALAYPHQFVFRVEQDLDEAKGNVNKLREDLLSKFQEWMKNSLKSHAPGFTLINGVANSIIEQHLKSALEVYWVAIVETGDYSTDYKRLTRLFDDRRHTRTFEQLPPLPTPVGNRTCSQCGLRPRIGRGEASHGKALFYAKDQLCAVCAAKRAWSGSGPPIGEVPNTHLLSRQRFFRDFPIPQDAIKDKVDLPLEEISCAGLREKLGRLSPYWALIVFDGDRMGEWFSGQHIPAGQDLAKFQAELSGVLQEFASGVKDICDELQCQHVYRVYTGGDDGLILSPLDFALPLARCIHEKWWECMHEIEQRIGKSPSFSLHLSLLHAKEPLQPAVADLHRRLEQAKDKGGRDCFSILANVRAGSPAWMVAGWSYLDQFVSCVELLGNYRLSDFTGKPVRAPDVHEREKRDLEALSSRVPHAMMEALDRFYEARRPHTLVSQEGLLHEWRRIIKRSRGGTDQAAGELLSFLEPRIQGLPEQGSGKKPPDSQSKITGPEAVRSSLEVMAFMARELRWGR